MQPEAFSAAQQAGVQPRRPPAGRLAGRGGARTRGCRVAARGCGQRVHGQHGQAHEGQQQQLQRDHGAQPGPAAVARPVKLDALPEGEEHGRHCTGGGGAGGVQCIGHRVGAQNCADPRQQARSAPTSDAARPNQAVGKRKS